MKKTRNLFKRLFAVLLSFAITFGSGIIPVSALESLSSVTVTKDEVLTAYNDFKTHKNEITDKITEINDSTPSAAKTEAVNEATEVLNEINSIFDNDTVIVTTTAYNVITVTVDFKDSTSLGLSLTNETLLNQAYADTLDVIKTYDNMVTFVLKYLDQSEDYTVLINDVGNYLETVETLVEKLEELEITYDRDTYQTYMVDFATLMISEANEENTSALNTLKADLTTFYDNGIILLGNSLQEKITSLESYVNNLTIDGLDTIKSDIATIKHQLGAEYNLIVVANDYLDVVSDLEALETNHKEDNPNTALVDEKIDEIESLLSEIYGSTLSIDQINAIKEISTYTTNTSLTLEALIGSMDQNKLADSLVAGTISYEILEAFVDLNNNNIEILNTIDNLNNIIETGTYPDPDSTTLKTYSNEQVNKLLFGTSSYYMNELNSLTNVSKTEEERLQILDKLNIVELSVEMLNSSLNQDVTELTSKIEELKEYYSISCDNTLKSLTANNITIDLSSSDQKITVGNDVTEIEILYELSDPNSTVEILNNKDLKVGENTITIVVTAPNGEVRNYTIIVVREEKQESSVVTTESTNDTNDSVTTLQTSTNTSSEDDNMTVDNEKISNTSDSNEKYNEELADESGVSVWIILLIVIGIALVGYGVYKLFGDKEDKKIDKAFESKKVETKKSNNNTHKNNKKRK